MTTTGAMKTGAQQAVYGQGGNGDGPFFPMLVMSDSAGRAVGANLLDIARGSVVGARPFGSFGKRTATGAVTTQVLWPDGAFILPPAVGVQLSLSSASAQDDSSGTGIRSVDVHYLDAALEPQFENVVLDGTSTVTTTASNIRFVQCMHGVTFGSGKAAAGLITASSGGTIYSQISAGEVRCTSSARMVPAGKRLFVMSMYSSSVSPGSSETTITFASTQFEEHDFAASSIFIPMAAGGFQDNGLVMNLPCPLMFTEGACVALTYSQSSTATVTGGWFGWLENA